MELYNEDCIKILSELPDNSIDLVLTDPPYGTIASKWDNVIPFDKIKDNLYRVLRPHGSIMLFASGLFVPRVMLFDEENYKYKYVWVKNKKGNFVHAKNRPMTQHEDILVFSKASMGHKSQVKTECIMNLLDSLK